MHEKPRYLLSQNPKKIVPEKLNVLLNKTRPIKIIINILSVEASV